MLIFVDILILTLQGAVTNRAVQEVVAAYAAAAQVERHRARARNPRKNRPLRRETQCQLLAFCIGYPVFASANH